MASVALTNQSPVFIAIITSQVQLLLWKLLFSEYNVLKCVTVFKKSFRKKTTLSINNHCIAQAPFYLINLFMDLLSFI